MILGNFSISLTGISGCLLRLRRLRRSNNLEISACVNFLSIIFESLKYKEFRITTNRLNFIFAPILKFTPTLKTGFDFLLDFDHKSFNFGVSLLGLGLNLKLW